MEKTPKMNVEDQKALASKKQRDAVMSAAINTCLEFDMAFKLMSYRVATQEMFLERCKSLAEFLLQEIERNNPDEDGKE